MRNKDSWKPSKYRLNNGSLIASKDPSEVWPPSRLMANLIAKKYELNIKKYVSGYLLDLGCGNVPLYAIYKDCTTDCYCVDWENTSHLNPYIDQMMDLNSELNLADNSFSTIILSDVLEHINQPERLIRETYRILKKDGHVLLNVPFMYWLHEEPYDYMRYTKYKLESMAKESGYKVILLEEIGGAVECIADIASKVLYNQSKFSRQFSLIIIRVTLWFLKTRMGERLSNGTKSKFPYGYFAVLNK